MRRSLSKQSSALSSPFNCQIVMTDCRNEASSKFQTLRPATWKDLCTVY